MKEYLLLVKDVNTKTLVTGDKQMRIVLETLYPEDIKELAKLANVIEVKVVFEYDEDKSG